MFITISSGDGVDEVCRALWHFYRWIEDRYSFETIHIEYGRCKRCIKSIVLRSEDKSFLDIEGTHLWKAQSPFRPNHKRKNWYFGLVCHREDKTNSIKKEQIIYQTMKSPKKGGQHVNTTNSGVRAIYPPLGLEAISYDERSQYRNRHIALFRLLKKIDEVAEKRDESIQKARWTENKSIQRGKEVLVFRGEKFHKLISNKLQYFKY